MQTHAGMKIVVFSRKRKKKKEVKVGEPRQLEHVSNDIAHVMIHAYLAKWILLAYALW